MTRRRFYFQLTTLTLVLGLVVFASQILEPLRPHIGFSLASLCIFAAVAAFLFHLGSKTALSKDRNAFTRVVMLSTFAKMAMALVIVLAYHRAAKPEGAFFVLPFFVIYFSYTIFETAFLSKLGKIKAH